MGAAATPRNAPCPCGSGRKFKRCCLADQERAAREARFDDAVGRRIQSWSSKQLAADVGAALAEFVGPERVMGDDDLQIFATWFHNDRELAGGGTPAARYAARADLPGDEREAASRIAAARLGLYRVLAVDPGRSLTLEDVGNGGRFEARSPHVSREAVRWDILLARVMAGQPPTLWGPTRFFEPCDESELRAELERLAGASLERLDEAARASTFRRHACELLRFRPARLTAEPSFFTLEGDPVAFATATWRVHDLAAVAEKLRDLGGLLPDEPVELDITVPRSSLLEQRSPLPPGAHVLEAGPVDAPETAPIAALRLEGRQLHAEAISEERIAYAIELVTEDLGELVEFREWKVTSVDDALAAQRAGRPRSLRSLRDPLDGGERRLVGDLVTERMRRWLDEPHQLLDGRTPRDVAAGPDRAEVVRLIRQLENGAERARRRGEPAADVARIRDELDLGDELAA
ncbi:MAG: SEC-C metal-binding domain-containing protein [Gaiellaceae bacterium]